MIPIGLPITWQGSDCFTHMLVVGPTRSGKTATILKPMIYQLLLQKKQGVPLGLSVVEPKGDVARMVNEMCTEMDIPCTHIDPELPHSHGFNPMEGGMDDVAEATVVVLKGLFGKQDAFFATVQELSARNVTKLLKALHGDKMDIIDVMNTLRDEKELEKKVKELKKRDGLTDLVHFFESELLGSMREKYRQFVIGLRAQLENITSNESLKRIMTGKSDINIDRHFEEGGVLAVNTALGKLRKAGDAFGQFIIMHLQNGTFRRPGTEQTRIPHFLIVDEYSRYINPDVEMFLSLAAEYRVSGIFATQSLGQLEVEAGKIGPKAMKQAILTSCRNKITFGGLSAGDAKEFAEEFGRDRVIMRQGTFKNRILIPKFFPESYRDTENEEYRFYYTDLMDGLPRFHFVHKLLQNGTPQPPAMAKGTFVPRDWKEKREWEGKRSWLLRRLHFIQKKRRKKEKALSMSESPQPPEAGMEEEQLLMEENPLQHKELAVRQEEEAETAKEKTSIEKPAEEKKTVVQQAVQTKDEVPPETLKKEKTNTETPNTETPESDTVTAKKKVFTPPQSSDGFWD
ncbi:type IV secretory system conjugative DNA transfer family protein [Domibacillus indicus]|uniref:type IV secretory system conjugative DNA transfer family protein n=1 Tax=Domibacillus indicus TaxID=1437523 RepID=UPI0020403871|nr:type IV secretory system conjugative DNA transfer family protein [Domibacillus indicus]MCM3791259.1 type IV secretory system conjugative DNA transfer family protein [Domibacillus indicus]